ncbi:MAG TPA: hypothetical protein DC054_24345 [Blastocatellia bacterium]|nr:hypothetical protein [Blastocatellia bacterium]
MHTIVIVDTKFQKWSNDSFVPIRVISWIVLPAHFERYFFQWQRTIYENTRTGTKPEPVVVVSCQFVDYRFCLH